MLNVLKKIDKSIEWVQLVMCCIIMFAIMNIQEDANGTQRIYARNDPYRA